MVPTAPAAQPTMVRLRSIAQVATRVPTDGTHVTLTTTDPGQWVVAPMTLEPLRGLPARLLPAHFALGGRRRGLGRDCHHRGGVDLLADGDELRRLRRRRCRPDHRDVVPLLLQRPRLGGAADASCRASPPASS